MAGGIYNGGGRRKPNPELDVATLQSLERKGAVADQVSLASVFTATADG